MEMMIMTAQTPATAQVAVWSSSLDELPLLSPAILELFSKNNTHPDAQIRLWVEIQTGFWKIWAAKLNRRENFALRKRVSCNLNLQVKRSADTETIVLEEIFALFLDEKGTLEDTT